MSVPIIAIDECETPSNGFIITTGKNANIDEAKTDISDLDSDDELHDGLLVTERRRSRGGSVTDVEHFTSESPQLNYSIEDYDAKVTLDEFLDQPSVDESSSYFGTKKKNTNHYKSNAPKTETVNLLGIEAIDQAGITDCEDMNDSGAEEDEEPVKYEYDDQAIVLEDGGSVDIHDQNKKRQEKPIPFIPKIKEPSSDSSDEERNPPPIRKRHLKRHSRIEEAKSDIEQMEFSDEERQSRRASYIPKNVDDADEVTLEASDVEDVPGLTMSKSMTFPEINITFTAHDTNSKPKRKNKIHFKPTSSATLGLPSNNDEGLTDIENLDSSDSECDGASGGTPRKGGFKMPIAVVRDTTGTDEESVGQISDVDDLLDPRLADDIDLPLPSPVREVKIVKEDERGQPQVEVFPISSEHLLGIDSNLDGGVTDCEDYSDDNDYDENYDESKYEIENMPAMQMEGEFITSANKNKDKSAPPSRRVSSQSASNLAVVINDNPLTDTEEMTFGPAAPNTGSGAGGGCELRRRRGRGKSNPNISSNNKKSGFLIVTHDDAGGHTDVEEMDFEDDKGSFASTYHGKRRPTEEISTILCSQNTFTDEENVTGDENDVSMPRGTPDRPLSALKDENFQCEINSHDVGDVNENKNKLRVKTRVPQIRKISPSPEVVISLTDVEEMQGNSEPDDEPYSRAQTATPAEMQQALQNSLEQSEVHESNTGVFDQRREINNLKNPRELDPILTDVSDVEYNPEDNQNGIAFRDLTSQCA